MPVKTEKIFTAEDVQKAAIKKHSEIDQYFCHLDEYILCFPDQKVVEYILGTSEVLLLQNIRNFYQSLTQKQISNISNIVVDNSNENLGRVAQWFVTCARKLKVPGSSPPTIYVKR